MKRIYVAASISLVALTATNCTTTELAAKSGASEVTAGENRCAGYQTRREECGDQVGCAWDNVRGTCARQ